MRRLGLKALLNAYTDRETPETYWHVTSGPSWYFQPVELMFLLVIGPVSIGIL